MQSEVWSQGNTGGQTLTEPEFWFGGLWARASYLQMCIEASTALLVLSVAYKYYQGIWI